MEDKEMVKKVFTPGKTFLINNCRAQLHCARKTVSQEVL
jgi:hypothetical protein